MLDSLDTLPVLITDGLCSSLEYGLAVFLSPVSELLVRLIGVVTITSVVSLVVALVAISTESSRKALSLRTEFVPD